MPDSNTMNALTAAGEKIARTRKAFNDAKTEAKAVAAAALLDGVYETTITTMLGVDRQTVRRWLGKQ